MRFKVGDKVIVKSFSEKPVGWDAFGNMANWMGKVVTIKKVDSDYAIHKPFTDTAYIHNGQWYWWSSVGQDYVKEYGYYEPDRVDECIDIVAWMPMHEPYKED